MTNWLKKENAIQAIDTSDIVITVGYNAKIEKNEKKILNHNNFITNNDFIKFQVQYLMKDQNKQNQQQMILKMQNNMLSEMKKKQKRYKPFI